MRLPIISYGGLYSKWRWLHDGQGCSSARHRQALDQRFSGNATVLVVSLIRRTLSKNICGRPAILKPRTPRLKDEVKYEPPSGASSIRWSPASYLVHLPTRCSTSLCCGKEGWLHSLQRNRPGYYSLSLFFTLQSEPDKQAQESVTGRYITRNAAEPHD